MYVDVMIDGRVYPYETSENYAKGDMVKVPFGNDILVGKVTAVDVEPPEFGEPKSVIELVTEEITEVVDTLSVRDISEVSKMYVDVESVWAKLDRMLPNPEELVVTEENYKDVKLSVLRTLRSVVKDLDEARKTPQRAFDAAKAEYNEAMKELVKRATERYERARALTDEFDEKVRKEHEQIATDAIEQAVHDFALEPEFAEKIIVRPEYLNLSTNKKTICNSVRKDAEQLAVAQETYHTRMEAIRVTIDDENKTLASGLVAENYTDIVRESSLTMQKLSVITDRIKKDAEERRRLEAYAVEKAKKAAEERVRREKEAEAKKKAEEEARALREAQEEKELYRQEEVVEKTLFVTGTNGQISEIMSFGTKLGAKIVLGF